MRGRCDDEISICKKKKKKICKTDEELPIDCTFDDIQMVTFLTCYSHIKKRWGILHNIDYM